MEVTFAHENPRSDITIWQYSEFAYYLTNIRIHLATLVDTLDK